MWGRNLLDPPQLTNKHINQILWDISLHTPPIKYSIINCHGYLNKVMHANK